MAELGLMKPNPQGLQTKKLMAVPRTRSLENWNILASKACYRPRKLAELCGVSLRQLQRRFRDEMGISPQAWLSQRRIEVAGEMLLTAQSIKEVSHRVGFKQPSHFSREFKRWFGKTPSDFYRTYAVRLVSQGK